jgi:hydrogenase/urease accessory protein HupE
MKFLRVVMWCIAATVFLSGAMLEAHEIGTTRVSVAFRNSASYDIEIVTDAAALVEKLEAVSGQAVENTSSRNAPVLQMLLKNYDEVFRHRMVAAFDGAAVSPSIDYTVSGTATATSSPVATIKLTGVLPHGAREFEWTYSWTFATYSLTVAADGDTRTTEWLEGGQRSTPVSLSGLVKAPRNRTTIAMEYLALGFTHIVPKGLDHMLFVLGIFLLGRRLRQILGQVSAFTIAHSITLALSVYGIVSVSPKIVEPLIAISIAYVAIENIFMSDLKPWRIALVFVFGLLHGMGFAGALKELGLPRSEFVTALVTFNLGVEAGQLAVIGAAFLLVGWYCGRRDWYRRFVVVPASILIACTAVYWTFERLSL